MASSGGALRGWEAADLLDVGRPERGIGVQQRARVAALVAKPIRPLLLVPGDDHSTRLGGELADAKRERDLGVEQMAEDLGGRPFAASGPARQAASRGSTDDAAQRAGRSGQGGEDVTATEPVVGHSTHRARHLASSSSCVMPYNSAP